MTRLIKILTEIAWYIKATIITTFITAIAAYLFINFAK